MILLKKLTFHRQFFKYSASELDLPIGLHDVTLSFEIQVDDLFHTLPPSQHFFVPKSSCLFPFQPQRVFCEPYFRLEELSGFTFKVVMEILSLRQDFSCSWDDTLPNSRPLFPFNMDFSTSEQSLRCSFPQFLTT